MLCRLMEVGPPGAPWRRSTQTTASFVGQEPGLSSATLFSINLPRYLALLNRCIALDPASNGAR